MRKILLSLGMIVFVGALVAGGTGAFFGDEETSTGNTFTAGAIDLQIDNTSFYLQDELGHMLVSASTTWALADLNDELGPGPEGAYLFFNFNDLKPGDIGEDTISFHVTNNDAWLCADLAITANDDNGSTEPELEDGDQPDDLGDVNDGELAQNLNFIFWADDGDNVLEVDEQVLTSGPASDVLNATPYRTYALADSQINIWTNQPNNPLDGSETFYLGKAWCFGTISEDREDQDTPGGPFDPENPNGPDQRGPGVSCNGASADNTTQTDTLVGDIRFRAVQSRNNNEFVCQPLDDDFGQGGEGGPTIGALLSSYTQTTACDLTVDNDTPQTGNNYNTIQAAVEVATTDQTICVDDDTYNEDVIIDVVGLTLAGDGATATTIINGQATGQGTAVKIEADNVTLEGFQINGAGIAALWISTGVSGATVQDNQITSASGATAVTTQGSQSNHLFQNNVLVGTDSTQVAYVNGNASLSLPSDDVDFLNNTFNGTVISTGLVLGNEATNSSIDQNIFNTSGSTFGVIETFASVSTDVNQNNFNSTTVNKVRNGDEGGTVNAENNWWGDTDPSDNVVGAVDFNPFESSAFPEN